MNDNHYLQCVSYLYKPSRLTKSSLKRCKNSSFSVENFGLKLWGKNYSSERGEGKMIEMHNIYPCNAFHMIEHSAF